MKRVVIVGGGFGGLNAAKSLANKDEISVILVDRTNHHLFQPLLYQVATAGLNPADIAVPIRSQFVGAPNVEIHLGKVNRVDLAKKTIGFQDTELTVPFDYLILACGSKHSYFGKSEWEDYAPGLKSLEQATEIRRRILSAFEHAENELDPERQKAFLNFVVVGGGATGVELAGAIADISRTVLVHDFRRIDPSKARVVLIEAGDRILGQFEPSLSKSAERDLRHLGVEVMTGTRVENVNAEGVSFSGTLLPAKSVFWAAGVQAAKMDIVPPVETDRAGRIKVKTDLSLPNAPDVFVIGDQALIEDIKGVVVPGLAPAAIQAGKFVAKNIERSIDGKPRLQFSYFDKGQMATIGKHRAVLQFGRIRMTGYLAWVAWLFVHIFYLVGFKNRISVFVQWVWSYLFSKRGSRLIVDKDWKLESQKNHDSKNQK